MSTSHELPDAPPPEDPEEAQPALAVAELEAADRLKMFLRDDRSIAEEGLSIKSPAQGPNIVGRFVLAELEAHIAVVRERDSRVRRPPILVTQMTEAIARAVFSSREPQAVQDRAKMEGLRHAHDYKDHYPQISRGFTLRGQLAKRKEVVLKDATTGLLAVYGLCAHRMLSQIKQREPR